jgi:hypothetical protein
MRAIAAVARFGESVGGESGELLGSHQLVDDGLEASLDDEVEVVDDLGALVAEVAKALEPGRSAHSAHSTPCRRREGALAAPPHDHD